MTSEMIRDRLVVGIMDDGLSKRLQRDPKLTLETAKTTVRQKEAVQEQQQALKGAQSSASNLDTLCYDRRGPPQRRDRTAKHKSANASLPRACTRCGKGTHPFAKCPARDAAFSRCQRKGHYRAICFTKASVTSIDADTQSDAAFMDTAFMDAMTSGGRENAWLAHIQLGG